MPFSDPYQEGLRLSAGGHYAPAIAQFERALNAHPDDVRVLFALGNTARALGLCKPAEEFYRRVLLLEPATLEAVVGLANLLRAQGRFEAAEALLCPALAKNPDAPELWLTLGSTWREIGDNERAAQHYREAIARRPNYTAALSNLADMTADDGNISEALTLYARALNAEPNNAQARLNRAILYLQTGMLKQGWRDYTARLKLPGKVPHPDHGLPRWNGASLKRRRLLVTAEQGIGDQIMFASMIPDLSERAATEGGKLLFECEPRLLALFSRSFPGIAVRPWDVETRAGSMIAHYAWLKAVGGANTAIEIGSLPRIMRRCIEDFLPRPSYLRVDSDEAGRWRGSFASLPKPLIGLCWRSGKTGGHRAVQYAPLASWAEFARDLPGTLVSVQYDASTDEIDALRTMSGRPIYVPGAIDQKNEIDRTAAMLSTLDALFSAPTAVAWLGAAVGVSTTKILYDTSWTCFGTAYEPFASSMTCAMPQARGDWKSAFGAAKDKLISRLG